MKGIPQGRYTKEFREEAVKMVTEGMDKSYGQTCLLHTPTTTPVVSQL